MSRQYTLFTRDSQCQHVGTALFSRISGRKILAVWRWLTNSSGRTARPRISVGFQDGRHRKRPGEQQNIKQGEQDFFHGETPLCRWSGSTVVMWIELGYSESWARNRPVF